MRRFSLTSAFGLLVFGALVCASSTPAAATSGKSKHAASGVQAINLVVTEVAAHRSESGKDEGRSWEVLRSGRMVLDLLSLRDGAWAAMGINRVPAGRYSEIRLSLGMGSSVMVEGASFPLRGSDDDKLRCHLVGFFEVPSGSDADVALNFDPGQAVRKSGSGEYSLNARIWMTASQVTPPQLGSISGVVMPAGVPTQVNVMQGGSLVATANVAADGSFMVSDLAPGMYDLVFHPMMPPYFDTPLDAVSVSAGAVTNVGNIFLRGE